jgi:early secretory antigenic target protein ESAT-6
MSQFQVDSDALLGATSALTGTVSQMQSLMGSLNGQLHNLAQSWTGGAALAFHDLVTEWQATQRMVESNLDEISVALASAHDHYAEVEAANLALFNR